MLFIGANVPYQSRISQALRPASSVCLPHSSSLSNSHHSRRTKAGTFVNNHTHNHSLTHHKNNSGRTTRARGQSPQSSFLFILDPIIPCPRAQTLREEPSPHPIPSWVSSPHQPRIALMRLLLATIFPLSQRVASRDSTLSPLYLRGSTIMNPIRRWDILSCWSSRPLWRWCV